MKQIQVDTLNIKWHVILCVFSFLFFDRGTEKLHLAILHPRKLSVYSISGDILCVSENRRIDIHGYIYNQKKNMR